MNGVCEESGGNPAKITNQLENDKAVWLMKARSIDTAFFGEWCVTSFHVV